MTSNVNKELDVTRIKMEVAHLDNLIIENPFPLSFQEIKEYDFERKIHLLRQNAPEKIAVTTSFRITGRIPNVDLLKSPVLTASYLFGFHFTDLQEFLSPEGSLSSIYPPLHLSLLALAYSTARGMLINQTKGTIFSGFILPVLPPKALLDKES